MADQAAVKTNASVTNRLGAIPAGSGAGPSSSDNGNAPGPGDMVTNVAEFGENLLSLAELQVRLATLELKQDAQTVKVTAPVLLGGAVLGIAGLPIVLAGIAELLVSELGMKRRFCLAGRWRRRPGHRRAVSLSPPSGFAARSSGSR